MVSAISDFRKKLFPIIKKVNKNLKRGGYHV